VARVGNRRYQKFGCPGAVRSPSSGTACVSPFSGEEGREVMLGNNRKREDFSRERREVS